jgi:hypothetical protein
MAKVCRDYTVVETTNKQGDLRWKVLLAREDLVSTCRTLEQATSMAASLNLDPYFLERGQTRADRATAYAASISKNIR